MSPWLLQLTAGLKTNFEGSPPTATLATLHRVDGVATAAARTVVVRDIDERGAMLIASDARSAKNAEVRQSPNATLVFWLASTKRQYRVAGKIDISVDDRPRVWAALSDRARALFAWPPPGSPRGDATFPEAVPAETPMPASFEVLRLTPTEVETLDLNSHPHERVCWTRTGNAWTSRHLNP